MGHGVVVHVVVVELEFEFVVDEHTGRRVPRECGGPIASPRLCRPVVDIRRGSQRPNTDDDDYDRSDS